MESSGRKSGVSLCPPAVYYVLTTKSKYIKKRSSLSVVIRKGEGDGLLAFQDDIIRSL
jgi:hypothetical protein